MTLSFPPVHLGTDAAENCYKVCRSRYRHPNLVLSELLSHNIVTYFACLFNTEKSGSTKSPLAAAFHRIVL